MVSLPGFYRYLSCFLTDVWKKAHIITVRRSEASPAEEAQIDFGYLGPWRYSLSWLERAHYLL